MTQSFLAVKTLCSEFLVPLSHSSRDYKLLKLPNGLTTFLVSDPSELICSAAVCVATGSHNDPPEVAGLAHLCEHMLFTGTKQYPNPSSYHQAIQSCGGSTNAYTTGEQTCFYFEVPSLSMKNTSDLNFDDILSIFASFFKNPLFDKRHIKSEILAVNEEYTENILILNKVLYHSTRLLANKNHPFSKFGTGNIQTLLAEAKAKKINLKKLLMAYFQTHFVVEKMTLVLKGPQSVNHLQKLAIKHFNSMPNSPSSSPTSSEYRHSFRSSLSAGPMTKSLNSIECSDIHCSPNILESAYNYFEPVFPNSHLGRCLFIESKKDNRVRLLFPIPPSVPPHFTRVWISILGDESEGTLCLHLINRDFAKEIYTSCQYLTHNDSCLMMDITTTKKGEKDLQAIISILFQYIHQVVLSQPLSEIARYIADMEATERIAYLYSEKNNSALDETSTLAERAQGNIEAIGRSNFVQGFCSWNEYDNRHSEWISASLNAFIEISEQVLSMTNFNLVVIGTLSSIPYICESIGSSPVVKDPFFEFEYQILRIRPHSLSSSDTELLIPKPNKFLLNFRLLDINEQLRMKQSESFSKAHSKPEAASPRLIDFSRMHEIWYQEEMAAKKISLSFKTQSFSIKPTVKNCILLEIVCFILGESLRFKLYPGELLGYLWGIYPSLNSTSSITISITGLECGFEDFCTEVIEEVIHRLKCMAAVGYNAIKMARMAIRNQYKQILSNSGLEKLVAASYAFLEENTWLVSERIDAIDEVTEDELIQISHKMLADLKYTSMLINGHLSETQISRMSRIVNSFTKHETVLMEKNPLPLLEPSSYLIEKGLNFSYLMQNTKEDPLNLILYYIQIGARKNAVERSLAALIEYLLSTKVQEDLRRKRQLGYGVFSGMMVLRKTIGVQIAVISGSNKPEHLKLQIEYFLRDWATEINNLSESGFQETIIEPFLDSLTAASEEEGIPRNLTYSIEPLKGNYQSLDLNHRSLWESIINRTYRFTTVGGREEIDLRLIRGLNKDFFKKFFNNKVSVTSLTRSSLTIMIESQVDDRERYNARQMIETYVSDKGLRLEREEIDKLAETCQEASVIPKEVFKLLRRKDQGSKFFKSAVTEVSISYMTSAMAAKSHAKERQVQTELSTRYMTIAGIGEFHKECAIAPRDRGQEVYETLDAIDIEAQELSRFYEQMDI